MKPIIIAHRGWSGRYPQNTLLAIDKALDLPVDGIEFDLRRTKDGEIVLCHDDNVDPYANASGYVRDFTLKELKEMDFGSKKSAEFAGTQIAEFNEMLDLVSAKRPDIWLAVELKEDDEDLARRAFKAVQEHGFGKQASVISGHANMLRYLREIAPEVPRHGFNAHNMSGKEQEDYLELIDRVGVSIFDLNLRISDFYHYHKIMLDTWAPCNAAQYALARACELESITTNDPDVILAFQEQTMPFGL